MSRALALAVVLWVGSLMAGVMVPDPTPEIVHLISDAPPAWIRVPFSEIREGRRYAVQCQSCGAAIVFTAASDAYVGDGGKWEVVAVVEHFE